MLTHAVGHIICNHFTHINIIGLDVQEENQANDNIDSVLPNTYNYLKKWYYLFDCLIIIGLIIYAKKM